VSAGVLPNAAMALLTIASTTAGYSARPDASTAVPAPIGHVAADDNLHSQANRGLREPSFQFSDAVPLSSSAYLVGWYGAAVSRVEALAGMPAGWDGHGSREIQPLPHRNMLGVLDTVAAMNAPAPFLSPISGGALQAEWCVNGRDLELVARSSGTIDFVKAVGEDADSIQTGSISAADIAGLQALAAWLLNEPRIHAAAA